LSKLHFGKIEIDPVQNPAILDTATWNPKEAWKILNAYPDSYWQEIWQQVKNRQFVKTGPSELQFYTSSLSSCRGVNYFLAELADKQNVILSIYEHSIESPLGISAFSRNVGTSLSLCMFDSSYSTLNSYLLKINPKKGPRAMGAVPRLGIGSRHSTLAWPGIFEAMKLKDFSANAIMNSVRELAILDEFLEGKEPRMNYLFGFGPIQEAYTGSTFEGIWTSGVLSAIKSDFSPRYGADADHLQIKRGSEGIQRTKKYLDSSRYYTFYTLDVSDLLDYNSMGSYSCSQALECLEKLIPDSGLRHDVTTFHRQKTWIGKKLFQFDEATIGRLVGKYWHALDCIEEIDRYITGMKDGQKYDLELTIDEVPSEFNVFDMITREEELLFLVHESIRRGMTLTHVAPNFGVEKATDYRGPDGLEGLGDRVARLHHIASEYGLMLDCHSGDDLSKDTRRVFRAATGGRLHFKLSPIIGDVFSQVLCNIHPETFAFWWEDTLNYAKRCAESGSFLAVNALKVFERSPDRSPSPKHIVFKEFKFASLGRKNERGELINRHIFYDLSQDFNEEFTARLRLSLAEIAEDLFG
jgi:hypothetical protein